MTISSLLSYPFETELLPWPAGSVLILDASYWNGASEFDGIDAVQNFYPDAYLWQAQGHDSVPELNGKSASTILCTLPKQKEAALYQLARCLQALESDGLLLVVAANDAGGKRLEKWMQEFGVVTQSTSKAKCRIAWAYKKDVQQDVIDKYIKAGSRQTRTIENQDYITQPGIFGWDKADKGSKLLIQHISEGLSGYGADFGCGYGYLSSYLLNNYSKIKNLTAIEADFRAIECAKANLKANEKVDFIWGDATFELNLKKPLDFVVMNPPFHAGKKSDSDLGVKFIQSAARTLKKQGVLYMVANAHLPYERTLGELFTSVEKLAEEQGFKIYKAVK